MPKPGWVSITLREERYKGLHRIYEKDSKRPHTQKFGAWFDNFVYELTTYEEELARFGPFLSVDNITDNHILLTDNLLNKHVFIGVNSKEKRLECEHEWELDDELRTMIEAWMDFDQFGILPWERNNKADDILLYWKNGIRFIDQMYNQAQANKRQGSKQMIDSDMEDVERQQQRRRGIGR